MFSSLAGVTYQYDTLVATPDVTDISTVSGAIGACCWWFTGPVMADDGTLGGDGWFPTRWSAYSIEALVQTPEEVIGDIVSALVALNINAGLSNALDSKLQNVLAAVDRANVGDNASAINMLYAFIQSVEAQRGKALSDAEADGLVGNAMTAIGLLENP